MENNLSTQPTDSTVIQSDRTAPEKTGKSRRGFASMDKERHKLVSSKGGHSPRTKSQINDQRNQGYSGF